MRDEPGHTTKGLRESVADLRRHADVTGSGPRDLLTLALFVSGTALSRLGERRGVRWLLYNPLLFAWFHAVNRRVAPGLIASLRSVFPDARRFADVGAGSGGMAAYAKKAGLDVVACEHSAVGRLFARAQGVRSLPFDLAADRPSELGPEADIAYCIEVAEHMPADMGDRLVSFLTQAAPTVVFTAAHPGQGGQGHINEQPQEYWIERFDRAGMTYAADRTARLRDELVANLRHGRWIPDNLMVFERSA